MYSKYFYYSSVLALLCLNTVAQGYVARVEQLSQEIITRIVGKSWEDTCPIHLEDLRYLQLSYWGYDDQEHIGEMIVHNDIAYEVIAIFGELFEARFPIEKMHLIDDYCVTGLTKNEIDDASMADNNSSGFFFRYVGKTTIVSEHGMGTAIDINPLVNPLVKGTAVFPPQSRKYCDRTQAEVKGLITDGSICVKIFAKYGWNWGGSWKKVHDYQHFCKVQNESVQ